MYEGEYDTITLVGTGDLSGKQHFAVDLLAQNVCGYNAGLGDVIGILKNKPQNGEHATVAIRGVTKISAGAAITAGQYVRPGSGGPAIAVSSGDTVPFTRLGRALTTAASGDTVVVALDITRFSEQSSGSIIGDV